MTNIDDWITEALNSGNPPYGTELTPILDFYDTVVSVNGYKVPHIKAMQLTDQDDRYNLCLGGRFVLENVDGDTVRQWMPFLAHAMAVAAGYSCHGENSELANPYKVKFGPLGG